MVIIQMKDFTKEVVCDNCKKKISIDSYIDDDNEITKEWISEIFSLDERPIRKDFCCKECYDKYKHEWDRRIK